MTGLIQEDKLVRALFPMPRNPWPDDMVIYIENDLEPLFELLWVREAWGLHPPGDVPPLLTDTPSFSGQPEDVKALESTWSEIWEGAVAHATKSLDYSQFMERIQETPEPREREKLIAEFFGPSWRAGFGDDSLSDDFASWLHRHFEGRETKASTPWQEDPERRSLDALIPAWKAGLTKIVTIPCRGDYTRPLSDSVLMTTEETRSDPDRYAQALQAFARR